MSAFHRNLKNFVERPGNSATAMSKTLGKSDYYIGSLLDHGRYPTADIAVHMCQVMQCTFQELMGLREDKYVTKVTDYSSELRAAAEALDRFIEGARQKQRLLHARPTIPDVMSWWRDAKGRIERDQGLLRFTDLWLLPETNGARPLPLEMGKSSLAATSFGFNDPRKLAGVMDFLPDQQVRNLIDAHLTAHNGKPVLTLESIDVTLSATGQRVKEDFLRLLLPVTTEDGSDLTVCFCCFPD